MKISEIVKYTGARIANAPRPEDLKLEKAFSSDLMSDVMGNASENEVWITLQTHHNVMAIASLKDLAAVILVKGLEPDADTHAHSDEEGVPILGTSMGAFEMAGKLYAFLNIMR